MLSSPRLSATPTPQPPKRVKSRIVQTNARFVPPVYPHTVRSEQKPLIPSKSPRGPSSLSTQAQIPRAKLPSRSLNHFLRTPRATSLGSAPSPSRQPLRVPPLSFRTTSHHDASSKFGPPMGPPPPMTPSVAARATVSTPALSPTPYRPWSHTEKKHRALSPVSPRTRTAGGLSPRGLSPRSPQSPRAMGPPPAGPTKPSSLLFHLPHPPSPPHIPSPRSGGGGGGEGVPPTSPRTPTSSTSASSSSLLSVSTPPPPLPETPFSSSAWSEPRPPATTCRIPMDGIVSPVGSLEDLSLWSTPALERGGRQRGDEAETSPSSVNLLLDLIHRLRRERDDLRHTIISTGTPLPAMHTHTPPRPHPHPHLPTHTHTHHAQARVQQEPQSHESGAVSTPCLQPHTQDPPSLPSLPHSNPDPNPHILQQHHRHQHRDQSVSFIPEMRSQCTNTTSPQLQGTHLLALCQDLRRLLQECGGFAREMVTSIGMDLGMDMGDDFDARRQMLSPSNHCNASAVEEDWALSQWLTSHSDGGDRCREQPPQEQQWGREAVRLLGMLQQGIRRLSERASRPSQRTIQTSAHIHTHDTDTMTESIPPTCQTIGTSAHIRTPTQDMHTMTQTLGLSTCIHTPTQERGTLTDLFKAVFHTVGTSTRIDTQDRDTMTEWIAILPSSSPPHRHMHTLARHEMDTMPTTNSAAQLQGGDDRTDLASIPSPTPTPAQRLDISAPLPSHTHDMGTLPGPQSLGLDKSTRTHPLRPRLDLSEHIIHALSPSPVHRHSKGTSTHDLAQQAPSHRHPPETHARVQQRVTSERMNGGPRSLMRTLDLRSLEEALGRAESSVFETRSLLRRTRRLPSSLNQRTHTRPQLLRSAPSHSSPSTHPNTFNTDPYIPQDLYSLDQHLLSLRKSFEQSLLHDEVPDGDDNTSNGDATAPTRTPPPPTDLHAMLEQTGARMQQAVMGWMEQRVGGDPMRENPYWEREEEEEERMASHDVDVDGGDK